MQDAEAPQKVGEGFEQEQEFARARARAFEQLNVRRGNRSDASGRKSRAVDSRAATAFWRGPLPEFRRSPVLSAVKPRSAAGTAIASVLVETAMMPTPRGRRLRS
jgi:hypothetical protein